MEAVGIESRFWSKSISALALAWLACAQKLLIRKSGLSTICYKAPKPLQAELTCPPYLGVVNQLLVLCVGVPEIDTKAPKQAMDIEFILKPQDGRADTVVNVVLAPSYVTYNGKTVQRIVDFFHTEEVSQPLFLQGQYYLK